MKSIKTVTRGTESSTPYIETSISEEYSIGTLHTFQHTNPKMFEYMNLTMENARLTQRNSSVPKMTKPRISIIPLTRQKVRVGQRSYKRSLGRKTADSTMTTRLSPSKKQLNEVHTKHTQFFMMMSFMYNKTKRNTCKLEILIDQFISYFQRKKEKDYLKQIEEISKLAVPLRSGLLQDYGYLSYELIKNCEFQLSKLFFNICYEIYLYKKNQFNLLQLCIVHRDIEYYSRRLSMLTLTLTTCLDMGRAYLDFFEFDKAEEQFSKALKLSVFVGDKYRQQLAIDRLGLCQYYRGDMMGAHFYHSSVDRLSSYNKVKILEHYSNQREIQNLLEEKTKEKSHQETVKEQFFRLNKENIQFNFDERSKDTEFIQNNYSQFKNGLKEMIKINSLRKKMPIIKSAMGKVRLIGQKKYKGKDYLVPKASKFYRRAGGDRSHDEIIQSHKSYNRNNVAFESVKIDKLCKILDQILNFFVCDAKEASRMIIEERQSLMSQLS